MPAIITHDFFGRDVYDDLYELIGGTKDEADAFLLGNQGPDPLFYTVVSPTLVSYNRTGSVMHKQKPAELLAGLRASLSVLNEEERPVGRAYALGFLCHYLLDSTMHPFVYYQEYAVCDAGEPGLSRDDGSEVHAVIESEFDELVLYAKRNQTVADFNPAKAILKASDFVLATVSKMYAYAAMTTYGASIPTDLFERGVRNFRLVQRAFYSPSGVKRALVGGVERRLRRHSFFQSMSHRAMPLEESAFDNRQHRPWKNPFTGEVSTQGFWDLYAAALTRAKRSVPRYARDDFDLAAARELTGDKNFSGDPTVAFVMAVEEVEDGAATGAAEATGTRAAYATAATGAAEATGTAAAPDATTTVAAETTDAEA